MMTFIIIAVIAILLIGIIVGIYNRLIRMIETVNNNKHQIDVQLDRRFKVFESLINVLKKYMDYEKSTLKDVVALRNQAQQAAQIGNEKERIAAENQISQIASGLNVVFEQYPDLKANQNALQLQEEIVSTENKLAFAKQAYNDSIQTYMAEKKSFFQSMIVRWFKAALDKDFIYWQLDEQKVNQLEDYKVNL